MWKKLSVYLNDDAIKVLGDVNGKELVEIALSKKIKSPTNSHNELNIVDVLVEKLEWAVKRVQELIYTNKYESKEQEFVNIDLSQPTDIMPLSIPIPLPKLSDKQLAFAESIISRIRDGVRDDWSRDVWYDTKDFDIVMSFVSQRMWINRVQWAMLEYIKLSTVDLFTNND